MLGLVTTIMMSTANQKILGITTYISFVTPVQHHHLPNKQNNKFYHR